MCVGGTDVSSRQGWWYSERDELCPVLNSTIEAGERCLLHKACWHVSVYVLRVEPCCLLMQGWLVASYALGSSRACGKVSFSEACVCIIITMFQVHANTCTRLSMYNARLSIVHVNQLFVLHVGIRLPLFAFSCCCLRCNAFCNLPDSQGCLQAALLQLPCSCSIAGT